ncbi:Hsp20/alpha crystallin family protein [Candidatus Bathyarchaeota archaeon]|nr:Hsp20/alpha crystallin family protein [Candidatus Bathyarchaeota archaeon]
MPSEDNSPEWFRKKRSPFFRSWGFDNVDKMFEEIEKMMETEFENFTSRVPKDYVRERKLPDGSTAREWGPFVYGYSVKIGSDGKPEVREFGNVKPSLKGPQVKEEREPLVDIVETDGEVQVVAELPGVEKKDIKLTSTEEELTISVDAPEHKYFKKIVFPAKVRVKEAKTQYKNGVLEVTLPKVDLHKQPEGESLKVD